MPSIYPLDIDQFSVKLNHSETVPGDIVYAEHINDLQDSVIAIENTLGPGINGSYLTLGDRLNSFSVGSSSVKVLSIDKTCIYKGHPLVVNGTTNSLQEAIAVFSSFTNVILSEYVNDNGYSQIGVLGDLFEQSSANFFGTVQVVSNGTGGWTTGTTASIQRWADRGAKGIYLVGIGHDDGFDRVAQNELIDHVHSLGMRVIVSGGILNLLNTDITPNNLGGDPLALNENDIYLMLGLNDDQVFLAENFKDSYGNGLGELEDQIYGTVKTVNWLRTTNYQFKTHCLVYDEPSLYYYYLGLATVLGVQGMCVQNENTDTNSIDITAYIPLINNISAPTHTVAYNGTTVFRNSNVGYIEANTSTKKFSFLSYKIPNEIIDFGGAAIILTSEMVRDVVIDGINDYAGSSRINANRVGPYSKDDYLNLYAGVEGAFDYISTAEPLQIQKPIIDILLTDDNGLTGIGFLVDKLLEEIPLDLSVRMLTAINLAAGTATIDNALIRDLSADVITTGILNSDRLASNSITTNHLTVEATTGRERWLLTVYPNTIKKTGDTFNLLDPKDFYGKRGFILEDIEVIDPEIVDSKCVFNLTDIIGYVPRYEGLHSVLLETYLVLDNIISQTYDITMQAEGTCAVYVDDDLVGSTGDITSTDELQEPFVVSLGWLAKGTHKISIVYQYIYTGTATNRSTIKMWSKLGKNISGFYPLPAINRLDCYANSSTVIDGARLRTGSVEADRLNAQEAVINFLTSGTIATDSMTANVIEAINAYIGSATIDVAKIGNLTAEYIFGAHIDTNDLQIVAQSTNPNDKSIMIFDPIGIRMFEDKNDLSNPRIWISRANGIIINSNPGLIFNNDGSIFFNSDTEAHTSRLTKNGYEHSFIRRFNDGDGTLVEHYKTALINDALIFRTPAASYTNDNIVQVDGDGFVIKDGSKTYVSLTKEGIKGVLTGDLDVGHITYDASLISIPTWASTPVEQIISNVGNQIIINLKIKWVRPVDYQTNNNLSGYKVYVKTSKTAYIPVATIGKDKEEYTMTGVLANDQYSIQVIPFGPFGLENQSDPGATYTTHAVTFNTIQDTSVPYVGQTDDYVPVLSSLVGAIKVTLPIIKYMSLNGDNSITCTNFSHYEIYRYNETINPNPDLNLLSPIGTTTSTAYLDRDVVYFNAYRYLYKAVNVYDTKSSFSPKSLDSCSPRQVGSDDIVANSITGEHIVGHSISAEQIDVESLSAKEVVTTIVKSTEFQTLYGDDLDVAIPFIKAQLQDPLLEIRNNTYDFATNGTTSDVMINNGVMHLEPLHRWDEVGLNWDSGAKWDTPFKTSGYWEMNSMTLVSPLLLIFFLSMSYTFDGVTYTSSKADDQVRGDVYLEISYLDQDNVSHSWEKPKQNYIYPIKNNLKIRVNLATSDINKDVVLNSLVLTCFKNSSNEFSENNIILNSQESNSNNAGITVKRGGALPDAMIRWNETSDVWESGVAGSMTAIGSGAGGGSPNLTLTELTLGNIMLRVGADGYSLEILIV